jgi:exosortase
MASRTKQSNRSRTQRKPTVRVDSPRAVRALSISPRIGVAAALLAGTLWSYWPILIELEATWDKEPDYSHGYFVVPVALAFLWIRRKEIPQRSSGIAWAGVALLLASCVVRWLGRVYYIDAVAAWSLPLWIAGLCWTFAGAKITRWALPSVLFLYFMIPLPFRAEHFLSLPLQTVATKLSCWLLVCCGEPAIAEGHVILIDDFAMEVVEACSGLRMFISIAALAFAYAVLSPSARRVKVLLAVSIVPIAILTNSIRIAATGLVYAHVSSDAAKSFSHDFAGWMMVPVAAAMMWFAIWYASRLFIEVQPSNPIDLLRPVRA